jgi:hypothetical protein
MATTTRALVLGGGGPVGIAWQAGLLLQPRVVGRVHPRQLCQLLAAQPGHPAVLAVVGQADIRRPQPRSAGPQKLSELTFLFHGSEYLGSVSGPTTP